MSSAEPRQRGRSWRAAITTFTIIPLRGGPETITARTAAGLTLWLPAVGCVLAVPAVGIMLAVEAGGGSGPRRLVGAALAVAALAVLTGGMHLDGLADTADGLGSRRPRQEALGLMRRPESGPMGVAVLVLTLLMQVTALAAISPRWLGPAALAAAVLTSRVAVVAAAGAPAARSDGFGALIAGTAGRRSRWTVVAVLLAIAGAVGAVAGGLQLAVRALAAVLAGLAAAGGLRRVACRSLGGMTGDVFGALIEISTATVLLAAALIPGR
jgi:adenosylcobinamide-GDP ribazoletransferase